MKIIKILNYQFPWLLMMMLITLQTLLAGPMIMPELIKGLDKVIHFFVFGILSWLLTRGFTNALNPFVRKNALWLILTTGVLFATLDETIQASIPSRVADIWDWLTDVAAIIFFMFLYKRRNRIKV